MLDEAAVLKRAITWSALAEYIRNTEGHSKAAGVFSKASAYIDVLDLPYSSQCGEKCQENVKAYAKQLAAKYSSAMNVTINGFLDAEISLNYWEYA